MRLKNLLANLLIVLLSTAFSLGLVVAAGELYFRRRVQKADSRTFPWMVFHAERGWSLQPGEYHHFDFNESLESRVSINDLGTRNPPLPLAVPPGQHRVSIIGDSFVFAAALNEEETLVGQLRKLLGDGYQVVNLGVESYGNGKEALLLEGLSARGFEVGRTLVLVFFSNDMMDNSGLEMGVSGRNASRPAFHVDSSGALRHTPPVRPEKELWRRKVADRSMFLVYLKSRLTNLATANPWLLDLAGRFGYRAKLPRTPGVVEGFYGAGWQERWGNTRDILAYVARTSRERLGTRLSIAYMPSPFQVLEALQQVARRQSGTDSSYAAFLGDIDRPQRLLREFCAREGVPFIDPTTALREASRKQTPYFLYEAHLNPLGSGIFAEALRDGILTAPP
ncbi:MAG: hypothetical protein ABIS67_09595 [Candidatus Eisenbacteria bacterium]